jgi:hypothetical protein
MICSRCEEREVTEGLCDHCLKMVHTFSMLSAPPAPVTKSNRLSRNRGGYKHASSSMAVDPEQVTEQREILYRSGVGDVEHTSSGQPVFTSDGQFQKAAKALGLKTGRDGYDNIRRATGREPERRKQAVIEKWANM